MRRRMNPLRLVKPDARRGPASERKANGVLGPRAAWLARIVEQGALGKCTGLLKYDIWDPLDEKLHRADDDLAAWRAGLTSGEDR